MINKKVDFIAMVEVSYANPNGDPLGGNMPRTDANGYGLISDVAIKRKIRNRMQDMGYPIFVQSRDRKKVISTLCRQGLKVNLKRKIRIKKLKKALMKNG